MNDIILNVVNLNKSFNLRRGFSDLFKFQKSQKVQIIDNVTFKISKGEILVLAGESGSGKTTLAKLIMRSINPDSGNIFFNNVDITKLKGKELLNIRSKVQMIFQDPYASLDPRMKVFDIVKEPLDVHKKRVNKKEVEEYVYSALKKVNLDPNEIASSYPHNLSGGQRQRVSFARSLVLKPLLIIADEPVSMLDVSIRIQILELMKKLKKEENVSFLYITHDLATSQYVGDNIIILYKGQIIEQGNIKQVLHHPLHPYTKALISAIPKFTDHDKEIKIKNDPEPASKLTNGCKFFNKCLYSTEECKIKEPPLTNDDTSDLRNNCSTNHFIRCFNYKVIL